MVSGVSSDNAEKRSWLPGSRLGVLGGGQLGRMFAMAAARMGYRVHVYAPEDESPAADASAQRTIAPFEDTGQLAAFAQAVDVVTLEFENIPAEAAQAVARYAPLRPGGDVLATTQHRLREKTFLTSCGIPCTPFAEAGSEAQLAEAVARIDLPGVIKSTAWGYDGKGQRLVRSWEEAEQARREVGASGAILEGWIDFQYELSMLVARSVTGETAVCGPIANAHAHHILDVSVFPHPELEAVRQEAETLALAAVEALGAIGLICIEFFLTRDGKLLVNEIAPRPHNSGHFTIDACYCSQFEQQLRAICGLPLGSFAMAAPAAAMANLMGDLWERGTPPWQEVLRDPRLRLHLYGKNDPRPGRKMGHLTALADSPAEAEQLVREARALLAPD